MDFVDKSLPFSLIVLEWALATAVRILAEEAVEFERMAIPVLDQIASRVCCVFDVVPPNTCRLSDNCLLCGGVFQKDQQPAACEVWCQ